MSTPSVTARTQPSLVGLFTRRYVSFAGKAILTGVNYATEDLTTAFAMYCQELVEGTQGTGGYLSEEARAYLDAVRGATGITDDLNSAVYVDLTQ
jgi:hypothetical protein